MNSFDRNCSNVVGRQREDIWVQLDQGNEVSRQQEGSKRIARGQQGGRFDEIHIVPPIQTVRIHNGRKSGIFCLLVYTKQCQGICRVYARYMQAICWVYVSYMLGICRLYVGYMQAICWVYVSYMQAICWVYVSYMQSICKLYVRYM